MTKMYAIQLRAFGGPEVLEVVSVERPTPGPGEVLVRIDAHGVNHHDVLVREGVLKIKTGRKFPLGVGLDFAGEVVATGDAAAAGASQPGSVGIGTAVWGMASPRQGHTTAAAAQYIAVPADRVAPIPSGLSMIEAASLVTPAVTALRAVSEVGLERGDRVLVRGAAGGVGMVILQLAHARGAHVTGLASDRDADFVASLGADDVLDYRAVSADDLGTFDAIITTIGRGMPAFRRRLTRDGRMVTVDFGSAAAMAAISSSVVHRSRRIRAFSSYPDTTLLTDVAGLVEGGAITPVIGGVFSMDQIGDAHNAMITRRGPGKVVVRMDH